MPTTFFDFINFSFNDFPKLIIINTIKIFIFKLNFQIDI